MASFDINDVARRQQHTSTGGTAFAFSFQVESASDLKVYVNDTLKTLTTHYTVSLNADGTGTVNFGSAVTSGDEVTIIGNKGHARTTAFSVGSALGSTSLNAEFDDVLIRQQQILERLDRAIQLKPSTTRVVTGAEFSTSGPLYLPYNETVSDNAGKHFVYNSAGTAIELSTFELTNVTASSAELNILDGCTLTTDELNQFDGFTIADEDDMSSNSATKLATQQSIKAYVDSQVASKDTLAELTDTNISSLASAHILIYDGSDSFDNKAVSGDITIDANGVVTIGNNKVLTAMINADAITGAKIADDAIDSEHYVDGSIDTAHIGDLQVTTAKIAADAITGAKIADDAIDSEHYTDGSIDTAHLGDLQVTTAKIAADAITAAKIADAAISEEHLDPSVINSLPDASIASADFLMFFDATDSALKKVDAAELGVGTALTEIVGDTSPQLGGTLDANGNAIDMNGLADGLILDTDADTTISAPTDDQIDIEIAGADDFTFTANTFTALTGSDIVHADTGSVRNRPNSQPIMINGDMQIAQRATTVTGVTTSTMATCDRVNFFISSAGTWTIKQTADAPTGSGFAKCYELDCTTADGSLSASDQARIELKFEGQDCQVFKKGTSSAEKMTVCFWVKSHKTGTHVLQVYDADNNRSVSQQYTISSADTWEKKTVNIPADTTGAFTNDNAESLNLSWWICAGTDFTSGTINTTWESRTLTKIADGQVNLADSTSNDWYITGVQLEVGEYNSTTLPSFQHESFGDSLARCQRYYYTSTIQTEDMLGVGWTFSATSVLRWNLQLPVFMRSAPTVSFQGDDVRLWNGANGTNAAVSVNYSDQNHLECDCSCDSGLTATVGIVAMIYLKTNGEVVATAEL
jgi:hypothetical protein